MLSIIKMIFYMVVFGSIALFIAFNSGQKVDVIFFTKLLTDVPLGVVLAISFFAGTLVSLPFFVTALIKANLNTASKIAKNNQKHKEIETKLTAKLKTKEQKTGAKPSLEASTAEDTKSLEMK